MAIDPQRLAEAVCHWTEFESRCGRSAMLSESYLAYPVAQALQAQTVNTIIPEWPHPNGPKAESRRVDFAIEDPTSGALVLAMEAKWIRSGSRAFDEELLRDMMRLSLIERPGASLWMLLAGQMKHIASTWRKQKNTKGGKRAAGVGSLLPFVPLEAINPAKWRYNKNASPLATLWERTAATLAVPAPLGLDIELVGTPAHWPMEVPKASLDWYACFVWKITSVVAN